MTDSRDFGARPQPTPQPLCDGFLYMLKNGRVIKLSRRDPKDQAVPFVEVYPWVARLDGQPRAGRPEELLYYKDDGTSYGGMLEWNIEAAPQERLIPVDRKVAALERLVQARAAGVQEEIWHTRNGRPLLVGEMNEEHLRNTLRMIIRAARKRHHAKQEAIALARKADEEFWYDMGEDRKWGSD